MNKLNHLCLLLVLLLFPFISISAQEMNISGVVIDNDGLTMPGVSVSVKGTTTGTITDIDGKYNLNEMCIRDSPNTADKIANRMKSLTTVQETMELFPQVCLEIWLDEIEE